MIRLLTILLAAVSFSNAAGNPEKGKELYLKSCSQCHGEAGDGKGPAAERMYTKPRDFTTGAYKIRTTPNGEVPTDEDLVRAISEGLPGSTMPAWKDAYGKDRIEDLVAYIKTFSTRFAEEKPSKVFSLSGAKKATPESLENGKKLFLEMSCNSCHGDSGRADGLSASSLTDDYSNPIRPANFHKGWKLRGGHGASDIYRALLTGLNGTPMPSYIDALGDTPEGLAKTWDLANYIHSLSPDVPNTGEVVRSQYSQDKLPENPFDPAWEKAKPTGFLLMGQIVEDPRLFDPSVDFIEVRSLYDSEDLAFLIEWDDPSRSPLEDKPLPDAFQIQVPRKLYPDSQEGEKPYFLEGDSGHPVDLWRWDSKKDKLVALLSRGLTAPKEAVPFTFISSSTYNEGRWRLVLRRKLATAENGLTFTPGTFIPIAFSAWDGSSGEEGAKRAVSSWYYLLLEPVRSKTLYAYPVLAFLFAGGLEFVYLKRRRKRGEPQ